MSNVAKRLRIYDPKKDGRLYVERQSGTREPYDEKKHGRLIDSRTKEVLPPSKWFVEDKKLLND